MRKLSALLLTLLTLLLPLTSCSSKPAGPLRICVDMDLDGSDSSKIKYEFESLMKKLAEQGGPEEYELEIVPADGEERMGALTRLRAEIMGGSGPDLFFVRSGWQEGLLFPYPEKSARNGLFLNLDKYMEKSKFTQWDQQVQTVLSAGRTDKGQFIVPLSYQFYMSCFRRSEVSHTPNTGTAWKDMAGSSDPVDRAAATFWGGSPQRLMTLADRTLHCTFGKLADYDKEELLFTADQVKECIHRNIELDDASKDGSFGDTPEYFQNVVGPSFNNGGQQFDLSMDSEPTPLTYIPLYSRDGGVTAAVRSYAAISAGSRHKDDAFLVLDYLLSQESQQYGNLYNKFFVGCGTFEGFPMDARIMSGEYPVKPRGSDALEWSLDKENFDGLCAVRDSITAVNFYDTVTLGLYELELDCLEIHDGYAEGDIDGLIDETCRVLQMSIQES